MADQNPIIVALDTRDLITAQRLVEDLSPYVWGFKVGLEFIWSQVTQLLTKPAAVASLSLHQLRWFFDQFEGHFMLDAKLDDIPNTVRGVLEAMLPITPWGVTIHASIGMEGLRQAVKSRGNVNILGVTVLTSIDLPECRRIYGTDTDVQVLSFAVDLATAGAQGIVCSPQELGILSSNTQLNALLTIVPGIRPAWASPGDQARIMTPKEAIDAGADYLVIGRPITRPPAEIGSPAEAAKRILAEIFG